MFCVKTSIVDELPHLRRYALFLARDVAIAEDLVQDCVERAIDRADQFKPGTSFRAWLFTILRSIFLNQQRRAANRPLAPEDNATAIQSSVGASQESHVEMRQLETALQKLSSAHRDVLLLIVIEGFSYEEAADMLEVPLGTVRSRLSRARRELSDLIGDTRGPTYSVAGG